MDRKVAYVEEESTAASYGIKAGDVIVSINGNRDFDIIDYLYDTADDETVLEIRTSDGKEKTLSVENDGMRPFGISFENMTADNPRVCRNHCVFCFMDQMPKGLRKSLYFKDDDYRLSFLMGNYITLTNVDDEELERIADMQLSPLNISVHVSDPEMRKTIMRNDDAVKIMDQLRFLKDNDIEFNIQLVLCPGINDGKYLEKSLEDMISLLPAVTSLSCVPVGLTKYRDGLYPLRSYTKEEALTVIKTVEEYGKKAREISEYVSFCASDEFFLIAGLPFPEDSYYGEYLQYENGVGMSRSFIDGAREFIDAEEGLVLSSEKTALITGVLGMKVLEGPIAEINSAFGTALKLYEVKNKFFGEDVTASGLVTGCDILDMLMTVPEETVLIPSNMLKDDEDVFLDNMTLDELKERSKKNIVIVSPDGYEFCENIKELLND